ncbi:hypothetical protein [Haloferula sargassicola]|uniref:Uncharacterized protein n=1 Tax=Haloferula sargassicola TaxID=490096 RepID=A0ABP9UT78_9BACT
MKLTIHPPFHLLRSWEVCWKCGAGAEAIAFAVAAVTCDDEDDDDLPVHSPVVLRDVEQAPLLFLAAATRSDADFKKRYSRAADREYFMNHCTCGAPFGDHFLHNEPGHAFYPLDPTDAASIKVHEIDCTESQEIDCWFAGWSSVCPVENGTPAERIAVPLG